MYVHIVVMRVYIRTCVPGRPGGAQRAERGDEASRAGLQGQGGSISCLVYACIHLF